MTNTASHAKIESTNPVLTVAPIKEETETSGATNKITALYCRLSQEDERAGESLSIENQENICQGGFHPKDEIPLINGNLLKNSPLSCFQAFQDPESDRLKNSIKAIAQHYADQICNQVCDVRGAVEERL